VPRRRDRSPLRAHLRLPAGRHDPQATHAGRGAVLRPVGPAAGDARGAVWKQRSRIGAGYVHSVVKPPVGLAHIGNDLDESTVQIITDLVIAKAEGAGAARSSRAILRLPTRAPSPRAGRCSPTMARTSDYPKRAYTAATTASEVDILQPWQ
jgi:hypothetical protein